MARFGLALLGFGIGAAAVAGCSSILGDFTTGNGALADSGPSADGPSGDTAGDVVTEGGLSDNFVADAGDAGDAVADGAADGPLQSLTCNTWRYTPPFMVANLSAFSGINAGIYQSVNTFSSDANKVRVVAGRSGAPVIFSVYDVDKTQSPPSVTSVDLPYNGSGQAQIWSVTRLKGGFGVVTSTTTGGIMSVSLYPFLDANSVSPLPAPVPIAQLPEGSTLQRAVEVVEVGPSAYFVAVDAQSTTHDFEIGVATGGQMAALTTIDTLNGLFDPVLAHVGTNVFMYILIQATGGSFYEVPDTASSGGPRQNIPAAGAFVVFGGVIDTVPGAASSTTNLAYEEIDSTDAGAIGSVGYRVGPVANSKLPTLTATDIPFAKSYADIGSFPSGSNGIHLWGDDFVILGHGQDGNGDPTQWMNFLWLNVNGVVRGDQSGINGLLSGHGPNIGEITASPSGTFTPQSGAWNVGWSESIFTDAGGYNALFLNELDCK